MPFNTDGWVVLYQAREQAQNQNMTLVRAGQTLACETHRTALTWGLLYGRLEKNLFVLPPSAALPKGFHGCVWMTPSVSNPSPHFAFHQVSS